MTIDCKGKSCFFCRRPIEGEGIEWQEKNNWRDNPVGEGLTNIYLHGRCAVKLGIRLIRDGMELVTDPDTKDFLQRQIKYEAGRYNDK